MEIMALKLEAACGCNMGKIRRNNEDNFLFDSRCLEPVNGGLASPLVMETPLRNDLCVAVFDGMGGENFGELASYTAAERLQQMTAGKAAFFVPDMETITETVEALNNAVVAKARDMYTEHMGTTMAALILHKGGAYVCSLGDSRVYRLRGGGLAQITTDHVERFNPSRPNRKRPLTQYLGIPPEEILLEPFAAKDELARGDQFLLCSDGLTDMVDDRTIRQLMLTAASARQCVQDLIGAALENGGRDNVTAIVCRVR
jgi:protein phosphatase